MNRLFGDVTCDYESFVETISRTRMPDRVHFVELFLDREIQDDIDARFEISKSLQPGDADYPLRRQIAIQRSLGYDYVVCEVEGAELAVNFTTHEDRTSVDGRRWLEQHSTPISSWEDFERFPWPESDHLSTAKLERLTELTPRRKA